MDRRIEEGEERSRPIPSFSKASEIPASARAVFAWHQRADALRSLIPPWEPVTVEQAPRSLRDGERAVLVMEFGPFRQRWVAVHSGYADHGAEGGEFTDEQESGPFARWRHRHVVRALSAERCVLEDRIDYALPMGMIGELAAGWYVRRKLRRMFEYRHEVTAREVKGMAG